MEISILQGGKYGIRFYPSHWPQQDGGEVPRFLFLGMCLVFHYPVVLGTFFVVSRRDLGKLQSTRLIQRIAQFNQCAT